MLLIFKQISFYYIELTLKLDIRNPSSASIYPQTTKAGYSGTAHIPQIDRKDIARQNISLKYKSGI